MVVVLKKLFIYLFILFRLILSGKIRSSLVSFRWQSFEDSVDQWRSWRRILSRLINMKYVLTQRSDLVPMCKVLTVGLFLYCMVNIVFFWWMQNEQYLSKLKQSNDRMLALVKASMDIVVAVGLLQLAPKKVTPRLTGGSGFLSSLISCYQVVSSLCNYG